MIKCFAARMRWFGRIKTDLFLQSCSRNTFFSSRESHDHQPDVATDTDHEKDDNSMKVEDHGAACFTMTCHKDKQNL